MKIQDDLGEEFGDDAGGQAQAAGEHARQEAAQMREGQRAIDAPRRLRGDELLGGQIGCEGIEVVADHLGADVLTGREPGQAGRMLERQAVLEALEGLFDAPAAVIEIGEGRRGVARAIEQGSHQHAHLAGWSHLADQAHRGGLPGTFIIGRIAAIGRRQSHHRLVESAAQELRDRGKARRRIAAHAKRDAAMQQGGDQPRPRKAAIEHQQVVAVKPVEALEQHLPLADQGTVQNQRIEQLDPRPQQAEQRRLAHATPALAVKQRQANLRGVGGQNPQSLPQRLIWQGLIDQPQQLRVERIEDIGPKTAARLRKCAGGDHTAQAAAPCQQREERIEFALHGAAHAGEQKGNQMGEAQIPFAREIPGEPLRERPRSE